MRGLGQVGTPEEEPHGNVGARSIIGHLNFRSQAAEDRLAVAHLGNIARRVGERLTWDPVAERFTNSDKANGHLEREHRKGYELSKG